MKVPTLLLAIGVAVAADSPSLAIDARIRAFERDVDAAFVPVGRELDAWQARRTRDAAAEVGRMLHDAAPGDRLYLAYQLLAVDPANAAAREAYAAAAQPAPVDAEGRPVPGARAPACANPALLARTADLRYPAFDEVAKAIDLRGSIAAPFWRRLETEQSGLRGDLVKLAGDRATSDAVYTLLAYYQPRVPEVRQHFARGGKAMPAQRTWFNPVDRWLLDHELAGVDPLRPTPVRTGPPLLPPPWTGATGGDLPAILPGAAVEVVATWQPGASVTLSGPQGSLVTWSVGDGTVTIQPAKGQAVQAKLDAALGSLEVPVRCTLSGRHAAFEVGGAPILEVDLPQYAAIKRWAVIGLAEPHLLRVRFLAARPDPAPATAAPAAAAADPPWLAERRKALAATVSCAFEDERLDEVAAALTSITGTPFRLGASADPLKDLPITMTAKAVPLATALEWLHRLAEIEAVPDEGGFRLEWRRGH